MAVYCFAPISALKEISIHRRKVNTKNYSIHKRKVKNYNIIRKSKHSHRSNVVLFLSLRPIRVTRCKWAEFLSRPVTRLTSFAWHESHTCYVIVACRCLCRWQMIFSRLRSQLIKIVLDFLNKIDKQVKGCALSSARAEFLVVKCCFRCFDIITIKNGIENNLSNKIKLEILPSPRTMHSPSLVCRFYLWKSLLTRCVHVLLFTS